MAETPSRPVAPHGVMQMLAAHVPMTLLLDLAGMPEGGSRDILEREAPDDLAWLHRCAAPAA